MPELLHLQTFKDNRGSLTGIEKILPFDIKRLFYIYGVDESVRGRHRHQKTIHAVCIAGSCVISNDDGKTRRDFLLDSPEKCLLLFPEDYQWMHHFTPGSILLVMASEYFDHNDYIHEPYR